jgi:hypothetical protein
MAAHAVRSRPALVDALMGVIGDYVPARALLRPSTLRALLSPGAGRQP